MSNKGFTLIELLAVIVILAVIALITVPAVMNVVADAKQSAFKDSAYGLIKTADSEYVQDTFEDNTIDKFFLFTNGVMTSYPSGSTLDYKGSTPLDGGLVLHSDGTVTMAIHDGTYCAVKTRYASEVTISSINKTNCNNEILYSQASAPFTNLVTNGDFASGTTGWAGGGVLTAQSNTLTSTATGSSIYVEAYSQAVYTHAVNSKIYMKVDTRVTTSSSTRLAIMISNGTTTILRSIITPIINNWYNLSVIDSYLGTNTTYGFFYVGHYYANTTIALGKTMEAKNVISIDLTNIYGAGSEPTVAQMDHNLNKVWIDTANGNTPKRFTAGGWINF